MSQSLKYLLLKPDMTITMKPCNHNSEEVNGNRRTPPAHWPDRLCEPANSRLIEKDNLMESYRGRYLTLSSGLQRQTCTHTHENGLISHTVILPYTNVFITNYIHIQLCQNPLLWKYWVNTL